jgi:hypothetical protein
VAEHPEIRLLLSCAQSRREPERTAGIEVLLQAEMNWDFVLRHAHYHRVMPLLSWQLGAISPGLVPPGIMNTLGAYSQDHSLKNLYLTRELLRLLHELEAHGIHAIPYKGPVLASLAYGNLALREFGDLDILVRRQDVLRAGDLLVSSGYRLADRLTRSQEVAYLRYGDQYHYVRDRDGTLVEIHWGFASRAYSFLLDTERQWWQLESVAVGGSAVRTFSPEDLLLILCVHGSMHLWKRLQWVCDVAELIQARGVTDWDRLLERSTEMGCRRALLLGLSLANDLLGTSIPEPVAQRLRADSSADALVDEVRVRLFEDTADLQRPVEDRAFQPFHVKVLERMRDKVRYCLRQATVPSWEDFELVPLPAHLFPAYRLLRPIRLTGKYAQRLLHRAWMNRP